MNDESEFQTNKKTLTASTLLSHSILVFSRVSLVFVRSSQTFFAENIWTFGTSSKDFRNDSSSTAPAPAPPVKVKQQKRYVIKN